MAIYSLADLRSSAPQELRELPDDELVREYSKRKKIPFEAVADYLDLKPRGFASEMGRQIVGGLRVEVPKMVGQMQQTFARELPDITEFLEAGAQAQAAAQPAAITAPTGLRPTPSGAVAETGRRLREEAAKAEPSYVPDMRGRGLAQETLLAGARAVGPVAATIPAAVVPGGMPLAVGGLFGLSQAQETYEKLIAQGVPEEEAVRASRITGAIQGTGEAVATYVGGKLFRPLLGRAGGGTTAGVAAEMTDTGVLKPFAKGMATNLLVQPTTEIGQDVGTSLVEQAYGAKPEDLMDIAKQSAMGATGLTLLLGPFALGAHVTRSNNAATLKAALSDDPTVPPEVRAQAIAAVNVEAQRQGVSPRDISRWTQEQIDLEDRRTDAIRRMTEAVQSLEVGAGIEQRLGIGAPRLNEADYIQQFEEAFNEPSGQFVYETLPDGSQAPRELTMGEVLDRQANIDPSAPKDLLTSAEPKTAREVLAEIRQAANDPLSPSVWRFPVSTGLQDQQRALFAAGPEAFGQPRPVQGGLSPAQQAALGGTPPLGAGQVAALQGPLDQTIPRPAMGLTPTQQFAAAGPQAQTSATLPVPRSAPSGGAPTAVPPSAPAEPGVFSTAALVQPSAKPAKPAKPAKVTAPQKTPIARSIEQALEEELSLADKESDTARLSAILDEVNKKQLGAEIQGAKQIKVPGRVSLSQRSLLGIRDAIFRKSGKVAKAFGRKEQRVVDAVSDFTNAYDAYLNYSANITREVKRGAQAKADERIANLEELAKNVQNALYELGQSVDNNAKNVEAVVRVVKDTVQRKLAAPGKTKAKTLAALKSLDTALSSGWAAAKRESFMKELPDLADVSGQQIRPSTEMQEKAKGTPVSAIERAAKSGYVNPQGRGEKYTGLAGALQYLRFNTTPMGRVLAKALRDAIVESNNPAKISFVEKSGSRYDPKTNTVYINRGEQSAEVVLHETFHAALQWYVYQNPNAPAVKQLMVSLDRALAAKGLQGKALEVQVILQELVDKKRGLDAALELVSYTATLNDFRRAMQEIKTGDAPKSFLESIRSVWAMYKAIVRRMLGVNDTVASDVLSASMELLEQSTKAQIPVKLEGKPLQAAVQSNKATQSAAGISAQDYTGYTKRIAPAAISTKAFFDAVGWNENVVKNFDKVTGKMSEVIRKDFPTLERFLIYINSRFSAGELTSQEIENFKVNKNVGYQQMERLANFVLNRPAEQVRALFDYMDGNKKALDNLPDKGIMTRTADNVMDWYQTYVKDLPAAERSFFETRKFSEALLYASKSAQVASSTFGARKLSEVLGLKSRGEATLEGFKDWIAKDENGDLNINGRFYQVFKNDGLRPDAGPEPAGFMSISEYEKRGRKSPDGYQVDATRQWWLSKFDPDKGYKFSSSMTAKQALEENKVDELANAMRNTMAALANNYASRQFAKALAADKTVVFDSLEDIKKFSGQIVDENQVLNVGQEESKSPQIRSMYRRSGTWVKIPDSSAYGDLADKYMPGPVWSAMIDMSDRRPLVDLKAYNTGMRWFKKSKTIYNPGTHITNIASNITLAMMHDIPMATLGKAARMFALYETNPKALTNTELDMISSFINSGAMLGNFSSAEVKQALYDAWKDNMSPANDNSVLKRLAAFTNYEKSKSQKVTQMAAKFGAKVDTYATELYAAEDNVFRLAAFLTKAGDLQVRDKTKVATPEQLRSAGDFARKAFLDYDIDSKAVRVLRQSFIPFISWGYAVAPVLGRIALHQPWKIANILMAYYLLEVGMASMGGGDDDELRKAGPEYMRERMFFGSFGPRMYIRIPFMGDTENPVYYKLGDYVPFASMTKGLPNGLFGQSWIPSIITPSGPIVSAISGLLLGVDPFSGKDIHKPTDSQWDKLFNSAKFAYDTAMPPAVSSANFKKIKDIVDEKQGITGAPPSSLVLARIFGFKLYDYNVEESLAIQDKIVKGVERDFKAAMAKAKRDEYAKGYPDYEALDKELDVLRDRMEKRIAEIRGEEEEEE